MEPPLSAPPSSATAAAAVAPPAAAQAHLAYPDSVDSSPRSQKTDSWDELVCPGGGALTGTASAKLRLMCSYGGHIMPRPHDKSLCYAGGDTRIMVADRHSTLADLSNRLSKTLLNGRSFILKYQLPSEELDSLISVTTDEDLENMIDEYDRLNSAGTAAAKSSRLRLFLFPLNPESVTSIGSLLESSAKSEDWFLNVLNGATRGFSDSASVNCLLGLDNDIVNAKNSNSDEKDVEGQIESFGTGKGVNSGGGNSNKQSTQDVHSVPDSPMLETTSSFGSTSSSPSIANLPPIQVHVEDQKVGIEEQFSQMSVQQKQDDGGFMVLTSPPAALTTTPVPATTVVSCVPMSSGLVVGDYSNRVFSDDERSEQGILVGYRQPLQAQPQVQPQPLQAQAQPQIQPHPQLQPQPQPQQSVPPQLQQKPAGGLDVASPDSVSSDGSVTNPLSRKPPMYQDPNVQLPSVSSRPPANPVDPKFTDPNSRVQLAQVQEAGYVLQTQFDQQNPQLHQQQFIHAGTQYIHHHPAGAVPMASYYPMYPPQQQHHPLHSPLDQQCPVYYVPAGQAQAYNLPIQQPNYGEAATAAPSSRPQTPPVASMVHTSAAFNLTRNAAASKTEVAGGVYRTATAPAPQFVQVPSSQHQPQYVGFTQIHHPSQSVAPTLATANYAYEFADPSYAQMYYTQAMAPQLAAQYQAMTTAPPVVLHEGSPQLASENIQQQIRTLQP